MTRKEAKEILLKFVEDNKYKSDWNGFLAGVISTYLEPFDEDKLDEFANEYSKQVSDGHNYRDLITGFKAGYHKAIEEYKILDQIKNDITDLMKKSDETSNKSCDKTVIDIHTGMAAAYETVLKLIKIYENEI